MTNDPKYSVERAAIYDLKHLGATFLLDDERGVFVDAGGYYKCFFTKPDEFERYVSEHKLTGTVCVMGLPDGAGGRFDVESCRTYAYFKPLPPTLRGDVTIKRLAPTLAETVLKHYSKVPYTADEMAELIRSRGMFGAIVDGNLAGFIGFHESGEMGMLTVLEKYRRRGIGSELERFAMNYVMTFGRTPVCDVYEDNALSVAMQEKLGLTAAATRTYWIKL